MIFYQHMTNSKTMSKTGSGNGGKGCTSNQILAGLVSSSLVYYFFSLRPQIGSLCIFYICLLYFLFFVLFEIFSFYKI